MMELDLNKLGKKIKIMRIMLDLTQRELSEKADIAEKYLSQIENGNVNCSITMMYNLANALNVSLDYLFEGQLNCTSMGEYSDPVSQAIMTNLGTLSENQKVYINETINLIKKHGISAETEN